MRREADFSFNSSTRVSNSSRFVAILATSMTAFFRLSLACATFAGARRLDAVTYSFLSGWRTSLCIPFPFAWMFVTIALPDWAMPSWIASTYSRRFLYVDIRAFADAAAFEASRSFSFARWTARVASALDCSTAVIRSAAFFLYSSRIKRSFS